MTPRSWAKGAYTNLTCFYEVDKGGHFATWNEPEPFSEALRAAFRSPYARRSEGTGVGHNLPQEAPQASAEAVIEVDGY